MGEGEKEDVLVENKISMHFQNKYISRTSFAFPIAISTGSWKNISTKSDIINSSTCL